MNCSNCRWARLKSPHGPRYWCCHPATQEARPLITGEERPGAALPACKSIRSGMAKPGIDWADRPRHRGNFWPWSFRAESVRYCGGAERRVVMDEFASGAQDG